MMFSVINEFDMVVNLMFMRNFVVDDFVMDIVVGNFVDDFVMDIMVGNFVDDFVMDVMMVDYGMGIVVDVMMIISIMVIANMVINMSLHIMMVMSSHISVMP